MKKCCPITGVRVGLKGQFESKEKTFNNKNQKFHQCIWIMSGSNRLTSENSSCSGCQLNLALPPPSSRPSWAHASPGTIP